MRRFGGLSALAALGALSAATYAGALSAAAWLGVGLLAAHPVVVAVLFVLYLAAAWLVSVRILPTKKALAVVLGFGLLFRVLMLPTPVYLSSDLFRYLWDGRVQLAGVNPYRYAPSAPELAYLRDGEIHPRINRPAARTIYPPAAQWLFALAAALAPGSIVGWRLLLLLFDGATVAILLLLLRRLGMSPTAVIIYAWSPLVVFEGVQAGHVEAAMIPLILLALLLRQTGSLVLAGVALGAGALGFLPEYLASPEDHNIGLRALLTHPFGFTGEVARGVAMALLFAALAATLVIIGRRAGQDPPGLWRASTLAVCSYLLLVPTAMHPWYVVWVVPFLSVRPSPAWLWFSGAVTLSYVAYVVTPAPLPWWAWLLEYGPLYALF